MKHGRFPKIVMSATLVFIKSCDGNNTAVHVFGTPQCPPQRAVTTESCQKPAPGSSILLGNHFCGAEGPLTVFVSRAAFALTIFVTPALTSDVLRSLSSTNILKTWQGDVNVLCNLLCIITGATAVFTFDVGDQRGRANGFVLRDPRTAATGTVFIR
jgi:hypothetical protein